MNELNLGGYIINKNSKPYIIAEIGVNHECSLERAFELIELAKEGGANAAKFQTYKADKIASEESPSYWDLAMEPTTSQHQLFKKFDKFGEQEYLACYEHCKKVGIQFLSTPFDDEAIDFVDKLVPFHKVASADICNVAFLRKIARTGKPIILSTGASYLFEIQNAVEIIKSQGNNDIVLLHCILNYPTPYEGANLNMMLSLKQNFPDYFVGLSDHTLADEGMLSLTTAYVLGAKVIEKHFTHDKTIKGNDHKHSMDVNDLSKFTANISFVNSLFGQESKAPLDEEFLSRDNARRSIVISRDLKEGHLISEEDITYKRPSHGISTYFWDEVLGKRVVMDLPKDQVLQWSMLTNA